MNTYVSTTVRRLPVLHDTTTLELCHYALDGNILHIYVSIINLNVFDLYNKPPLTSIQAPDMYRARLEARKAAASAMSSGSPKSPRGLPDNFSARATAHDAVSFFGFVKGICI